MRTIVLFLFASFLAIEALAKETLIKTEANVPVEILFTAEQTHTDPFNTVQLDVLFTSESGVEQVVPAFWGGGKNWKVRYASPTPGNYRFVSKSNVTTDPGLEGVGGKILITEYRGANPLFKHGPIKVASDLRHFEHADGTPFVWLGDTWWMGLCHRLHWPEDFKKLATDRKEKGFNVIQIVAGLYPDMHPFDPRGANEAGFPWQTNYTAIRPEYFDAVDQRLRYLIDEGFTPCIVGAWGYFLPWMGEERAKQHWRELIARYGSSPVVWCIAGEANLPWYLAPGFPYDDRELVKGWTEVARYVRATDPFKRPATIHPTGIGKLNSRWTINDASLIDFDMLQTPHGQREAVAPTIGAFQHAYNLKPKMPVVNGEPSYENLNGVIAAQWPRAMFWLCMINGAAGHTYGGNGIWQVNRRDMPHGASPHGGNYGTTPWDEAMHYPGGKQVAMGKKFLDQFPLHKCLPQPETVTWAETGQGKEWGNWIWYPEGEPSVTAPLAKRYFRRTFALTKDSKLKRATLHVSADNRAAAWINGKMVGEASDWQSPQSFDVTSLLNEKNIIALEAENFAPPVAPNPAGLNAVLELETENGKTLIQTDEQWRAAQAGSDGWQSLKFNDSEWGMAKVLAAYGSGPWGKIESDPLSAPFALGIGDELRLVYAISPQSVVVSGLRRNARYTVQIFDPVSGEVINRNIRTGQTDSMVFENPRHGHDWVLALRVVK